MQGLGSGEQSLVDAQTPLSQTAEVTGANEQGSSNAQAQRVPNWRQTSLRGKQQEKEDKAQGVPRQKSSKTGGNNLDPTKVTPQGGMGCGGNREGVVLQGSSGVKEGSREGSADSLLSSGEGAAMREQSALSQRDEQSDAAAQEEGELPSSGQEMDIVVARTDEDGQTFNAAGEQMHEESPTLDAESLTVDIGLEAFEADLPENLCRPEIGQTATKGVRGQILRAMQTATLPVGTHLMVAVLVQQTRTLVIHCKVPRTFWGLSKQLIKG
eukprot:651840-Rhodomonas_salina.2